MTLDAVLDYELPLPKLKVSIPAIDIETKGKTTGNFVVKNITPGATPLHGRIIHRTKGLTISPTQWTAKEQIISYIFDAKEAGLKTGEHIATTITVSTSGGEQVIPLTARLTEMSIPTAEGGIIAGLQDFYDYAITHPAQARRMFVDGEFYMLLLALGYKYIEVYEALHRDSNRERAMDNFFILSGLKNKTTLSVANKTLTFYQNPGATGNIPGSITVEKSDQGFIDAPITVQNNSPWLTCFAARLIHSDFKDGKTAQVGFNINPAHIPQSFARDVIVVGSDPHNTAEIIYKRKNIADITLSRGGYRYSDTGYIQVINNMAADIRVEVFCKDTYLRLGARSYIVSPLAGEPFQIPFEIKLSAFLNAQVFFRKTPLMKSTIEIKVTAPGHVYRKNLALTVGDW